MKTGNGMIANLPEHVREELNWRINDGGEGPELVSWLNAKLEVVEVVKSRCDGVPTSEQCTGGRALHTLSRSAVGIEARASKSLPVAHARLS